MSEEALLKIFKMTQEGRITPEEGVELAEALLKKGSREPGESFDKDSFKRSIRDFVSSTASMAAASALSGLSGKPGRCESSFSVGEKTVFLKADESSLKIQKSRDREGHISVKALSSQVWGEEDRVNIDLSFSKGKVYLPADCRLVVEADRAKIEIEDLPVPIEMRGSGSKFFLEFEEEHQGIDIETDASVIELEVPGNKSDRIELEAEMGKISFPLDAGLKEIDGKVTAGPEEHYERLIKVVARRGKISFDYTGEK